MEAAVNSKTRDRLSELPNSLKDLILAFLPEVISTSLLSKCWKDLWKTVPCLNFCDNLSKLDNGADSFRNFVNRVLMFWKGGKISKFKIDIAPHFDRSLAGDIDLWLRFAIENEVDELNLHLMYEPEDNFEDWMDDAQMCSKKEMFYVPQCLNACTSITKLSLVGCNLRIRKPTSWNQLKSLRIDGFCYSERVINRIMLGSPRLEVFELRLMEDYENLNIRSASLKRLKVKKYFYYDYVEDASGDDVLSICCPNLEVLEFSGLLYPKYVFTNVSSSLTDVTLGFEDNSSSSYENYESLGQIFSIIQHVDKVALSPWCVQVWFLPNIYIVILII